MRIYSYAATLFLAIVPNERDKELLVGDKELLVGNNI